MNDYIDLNLWAQTHSHIDFLKSAKRILAEHPPSHHEQEKLYTSILKNRFEELSTQYSFLASIADELMISAPKLKLNSSLESDSSYENSQRLLSDIEQLVDLSSQLHRSIVNRGNECSDKCSQITSRASFAARAIQSSRELHKKKFLSAQKAYFKSMKKLKPLNEHNSYDLLGLSSEILEHNYSMSKIKFLHAIADESSGHITLRTSDLQELAQKVNRLITAQSQSTQFLNLFQSFLDFCKKHAEIISNDLKYMTEGDSPQPHRLITPRSYLISTRNYHKTPFILTLWMRLFLLHLFSKILFSWYQKDD